MRYGCQRQVNPRQQRSVGLVEGVTQNLGAPSHELFEPCDISARFAQAGDNETDFYVSDVASGTKGASEGERLFVESNAARGVYVVVDDGAVQHRDAL